MVQYYSTMMQDFLYTFFATPFSILLGSQVLNITQSTGGNVSQTIILYVLYLLGNWLFLTAYSTLMENLHKTIHHLIHERLNPLILEIYHEGGG